MGVTGLCRRTRENVVFSLTKKGPGARMAVDRKRPMKEFHRLWNGTKCINGIPLGQSAKRT